MGQILRRVQSGEQITITYRGGAPVLLVNPEHQQGLSSSGGGKHFLEAAQQLSAKMPLDNPYKTGNLKDIYHKELDNQYGLS